MRAAVFVTVAVALGLGAAVADAAVRDEADESDPVALVDPFIGSGGVGYGVGSVAPAAQVPFGLCRVGPDTTTAGLPLSFYHCGGYYYGDSSILAFSHTRLVGAGVADLGNVGIIPLAGRMISLPPVSSPRPLWSGHAFDHKHEHADPGYYSVTLAPHGPEAGRIQAETTAAGTHAGLHRYSFSPAAPERRILVDVCHAAFAAGPGACRNASLTRVAPPAGAAAAFEGSLRFLGALSGRGDPGGIRIHFAVVVEAAGPAPAVQFWANAALRPAQPEVSDTATSDKDSLGAALRWPSCGGEAGDCTVGVRVALSLVDVAGAWSNLRAQAGAATFDATRAAAADSWRALLSRMTFPAGVPAATRSTLLSALYRTSLSPTNYTEADGRYMGADNSVHRWPPARWPGGRGFFSDLSLWDTHRTQMPWLGLVHPQVAADTVRSVLTMGDQAGALPRWPLASVFAGCMVADHGIVSAADALRQGLLPDADVARVLDTCVRQVTENVPHNRRTALKHWAAHGYVPSEDAGASASLTLEYALDDWAVGRIALLAGNRSVAKRHLARARNYRNVWSPQHMLMCPRKAAAADGTPGAFDCPAFGSLPYPLSHRYTEGDAVQWRLFAPQDPHGLVALWESRDAFAHDLDRFFHGSLYLWEGGTWPFGNLLPEPNYWAGNEPGLFSVWLFLFAGRPDLTQRWSRWLLEHRYGSGADGIPGNDDFGTMSAWQAFASLGLYPVPGADVYLLGSPAVSGVTLTVPRPHGDCVLRLTVTAHNWSEEAVYVARASLNGQALPEPAVAVRDLAPPCSEGADTETAHLEIWMSPVKQPLWSGVVPSPAHWYGDE